MARTRMAGLGAAGLLVVAVFLLAGGGCGGEGSGGGSVFPEGGKVAEQEAVDLQEAADAAGCELEETRSRGQDDRLHTRSPDVNVDYRDNPPTIGRHWPSGFEAEAGLYSEAPADESLVHTLEHGRVIIWAKPSLPEDARQTLRALFDQDSYQLLPPAAQLLVVPRENMPYAVAATAWNGEPQPGGTGRTLGCEGWSPEAVDALRAFRDEHRSKGPEPAP